MTGLMLNRILSRAAIMVVAILSGMMSNSLAGEVRLDLPVSVLAVQDATEAYARCTVADSRLKAVRRSGLTFATNTVNLIGGDFKGRLSAKAKFSDVQLKPITHWACEIVFIRPGKRRLGTYSLRKSGRKLPQQFETLEDCVTGAFATPGKAELC